MNIRQDPRLAGRVLRYHTWPHVKTQSVGEHSWQVARILMTVWPAHSRELLRYALMHDMGEVKTGDVPYPFKADHPEVAAAFDLAESEAIVDMDEVFGCPVFPVLTSFEETIVKICDYLDMWEWALEEMNLGNKFAEPVRDRMRKAIGQKVTELGNEELTRRVVDYITKRNEQWTK
jgi:5'-deoxynucleotidase YfbR-like HD superfamily hydrolase